MGELADYFESVADKLNAEFKRILSIENLFLDSKRIREKVFDDRTRSDVLLIDRKEGPVIVECKRGGVSVTDIKQLRHYLERLNHETTLKARGILVHGGALKLSNDVRVEVEKEPAIEIVRYALRVDFERCS